MFKKFTKNCNFNIVLPNVHAKSIKNKFEKYNCNIIIANNTSYIPIVNELALLIKENDKFSIITEWDIVPIKNITEQRIASYRGPQSKLVKEIRTKVYYPNILGFNPSDTIYNDNFFKKNEKPFLNDFVELEHRILLDKDNFQECAITNNFSIIGTEWLHCLHGSNITPERLYCWNNILSSI
jgi:hypothetical protein